MTVASAASDPTAPEPGIVIRTPGVGAVEIAAVTAVLTAVTASNAAAPIGVHAPTAWSRSQRPIRRPLTPGAGRWRAFEG